MKTKILAALNKPIAGIPAWAWGGVVVGGLVIGRTFAKSKPGGTATDTSQSELAGGATGGPIFGGGYGEGIRTSEGTYNMPTPMTPPPDLIGGDVATQQPTAAVLDYPVADTRFIAPLSTAPAAPSIQQHLTATTTTTATRPPVAGYTRTSAGYIDNETGQNVGNTPPQPKTGVFTSIIAAITTDTAHRPQVQGYTRTNRGTYIDDSTKTELAKGVIPYSKAVIARNIADAKQAASNVIALRSGAKSTGSVFAATASPAALVNRMVTRAVATPAGSPAAAKPVTATTPGSTAVNNSPVGIQRTPQQLATYNSIRVAAQAWRRAH